MGALLGLPPRIMLVIITAILAFVIYHIVTTGKVQPLAGVALVVLAFAFVRTIVRLRRPQAGPDGNHSQSPASRADPPAAVTPAPPVTFVASAPLAMPQREAQPHVPAVELDAISKSYGPVRALQDVSFTIPQGQVVALLGPNGAGKSTAISIMLGLRHPSHGRARLLGQDPRDRRARSRCGIMLQESGVPFNLTVRETLDLFRGYYPYPLPAGRVLEMAGLTEKASARVGTLSGGQRQRLYFALAVCGDPDVLFLDEPTAGLDVEARQSFWEQIRAFVQQGKTILLTTHYLEEADALAERIVVIDHGKVRADASPAVLKAQVSTSRVSFDVSEPLPSALFAQLPVRQLELTDHHVNLLTTRLEPVLRAVFAQPVEITQLAITGATLEEAVLHLTQSQAGDSELKGA